MGELVENRIPREIQPEVEKVLASPVAFEILIRQHTDGNLTWKRPDGVDDMLFRRVLLAVLDYTQIDLVTALAASKTVELMEHERIKRMLKATGPEDNPFKWQDGRHS